MKKLRFKFQFALFLLVVIVFIGLGFCLGQLFKNQYLETYHKELEKQGQLIAQQIENNGGISNFKETDFKLLQNITDSRISIRNLDGNIIFDSGLNEDFYYKNDEVIAGIVKKIHRDENGIEHIGRGFDITYYWEIIGSVEQPDGLLILATTHDSLKEAYHQLWFILFIILTIAFLIILFISSRIISSFTRPVESAVKTAIELAKGNYQARTYEDYNSDFSMLNTSINILARNLQRITKEQEMHNDRLTTVIENMGIPLILIDDKGYVKLSNQIYNNVFRIQYEDLIGKNYLDVIEHKEIKQIIEEVFLTEQKIRKQVIIPINIQRKHFEVYGAPIISFNNEWKGIVLVFHDITDIKKLEQIRKDFVANVSHELKTPITSIKGFSETLLDGAMYDQNALKSFLQIILKESDRLQSLTHDLLELSRIEQDGFKLNIGEVKCLTMLKELKESLDQQAEDKQIHLEIHGEDVTIEGDKPRLQQIFINLMANALAYTPSKGRVDVYIKDVKDHVEISVKDTGIGIEQDEIPRIFERFYRVDKARSRYSGGTGLGLAIVKHLVEAHKGELDVKSELGKGSTFTVKLKKKFPH
ncbi:two-component system histidine kinase PnpS [Pallidibacillus thermolactis]|uniref:two-component system histidine kinase PnpS n=1 Tax=Pallidibacillus thermolactis TaxID=251051 RepID=UPI0021DB348C|nr:ATP-binding protein [Pallidibacillus thermolactis]MCU9601239.1 ATP-binding protein [Pallidibacillus thermolactis subsp. kokeshiiformis]